MSEEVRQRIKAGEQLPVGSMKIPMVDLPLGATGGASELCKGAGREEVGVGWAGFCWGWFRRLGGHIADPPLGATGVTRA